MGQAYNLIRLDDIRAAKGELPDDPRLKELEEWVNENPESVHLRIRELELLCQIAADELEGTPIAGLLLECLEDM